MSRRELLVLRVPAGTMKPEAFKEFREYVIESILRDVLVLSDDMAMEVEEVPIPGEVKVIAQAEIEEPKEPENHVVPKVGPKSAREEKQAILEKLKEYREKHGLGSFNLIATRANRKGVTGEILRMLLQGDAKLDMADWRAVGKVIDELGGGTDA